MICRSIVWIYLVFFIWIKFLKMYIFFNPKLHLPICMYHAVYNDQIFFMLIWETIFMLFKPRKYNTFTLKNGFLFNKRSKIKNIYRYKIALELELSKLQINRNDVSFCLSKVWQKIISFPRILFFNLKSCIEIKIHYYSAVSK